MHPLNLRYLGCVDYKVVKSDVLTIENKKMNMHLTSKLIML